VLARFFIDRPVFAWVISLVIVLAGGFGYATLPVAQYPEITPPTVQVSATYPGANAVVVQDTVAAPVEQQVNGVENMLYMSSNSGNDGSYNLTVTFEVGTDLNMAQVLVQNRVAQALPRLPQEVQAIGVTVKKRSPDILLAVNLFSDTNPRTGRPYFSQLHVSNYATLRLQDELARIKGVGDISLLGQQNYSMRLWVDPDKLASRGLTTGDVVNAVREQNVQVPAGQIGQPPVPPGEDFQYTVTTEGRLVTEEQFGNIILKTENDAITRVKDVARVKLGAQNMDVDCRLDGRPSVGIAVFLLPGANALDVADRVKARMRQLAERFPEGFRYIIAYDTTPFIRQSVNEVVLTLVYAVLLVGLVVLLFLQDWRAVLLPLIDVGVSLVGTFAVMKAIGFSLNTLTLFGLVLAIGIVVDDAIVVLENIERWLAKGLAVREATIRAMEEITGPIIGITLVLSSVFLPSAFLPGITGQFYRQFALTIAASMLISAINAMTMTPARAAAIFGHRRVSAHGHEGQEALPWWFFAILGGLVSLWLLEPVLGPRLGLTAGGEEAGEAGWLEAARLWALRVPLMLPGAVAGGLFGWLFIRPVNWALGKFFRGFNWAFDRVTAAYGRAVGWLLRLAVVVLVVYAGLLLLTGWAFTRVPTGFIPSQDQGYLVVDVQLPDAASLERTVAVTEEVGRIARKTPGVAHTLGVAGQSFVLNAVAPNTGAMFIILKPFEERDPEGLSADVIMARLQRSFAGKIEEGRVSVFGAPPVRGLGNTGGFKLMVQDQGGLGLGLLQGQADNLAEKASRLPTMLGVFNSFRAATPQVFVKIDKAKVKSLGVPLTEVDQTLQVFLGGYYVNDFNFEGRVWQVNVQAEPAFRLSADAIKKYYVRNADKEMVPLGSVVSARDASGPLLVTRYNMYTAAALNGVPRPGVSSGTVIRDMEALARENLPRSMAVEWTEITFLQIQAGSSGIWAFVLAVVLVFLVLAAQYESWSLPLAIILVVPMCILCALAGVVLARLDVNIFVQVGFVVLVGLAAKNAILIVQFARDRQQEGASAFGATLEAAVVRLRPIIMTSLAFILGVFPLVVAAGAGAEMRHTLGVAVFAGMFGVTLFGIFLTPVFYCSVMWLVGPTAGRPLPVQPDLPRPEGPRPGEAGDGVGRQAPDTAIRRRGPAP
jgi:multidrug efflux pump subunit AcrB